MKSHMMVAFAVATLIGALPPPARAECARRSATPASHVVELYTSEGCSSCPPAEKWLRALSKKDPAVVTLEFHVDYWDALGWHDRFSDAAYTQRQQELAAASASSVVYTPEVVVDGREWRSWESGELPAAHANTRAFELGLTPGEPLRAQLSVPGDSSSDPVVWYLAVTEANLASTVTAGENRGTKLLHDNVVRALAGPRPVAEAIDLPEIPADLDDQNASLVGLVVDARTRRAIAAERISLAGCLKPRKS